MAEMRSRTMIAAAWLLVLPARAQQVDAQRTELDAQLAREVRMEWITRAAVERSPALFETTARARAASERASEAERLPDPEFKYEQWGVPLSRPYALQRSDTLMFGLRQSFPAPGTRQARARMAGEDATIAGHQRRAMERDLIRRVRRAFFEYHAADRALEIHAEHIAIAEQTVAQLRAGYEVGRGSQQDLLKAVVELSRVHTDVAETTRERDTSRYLLNTLLARATDAPLGRPSIELRRERLAVDPAALADTLDTNRPEVAIARSAVRQSETALEAAQHSARRPSFMVGIDYWLMPMLDSPHGYGAMVAMSLPWLNPARRAEVRASSASARADRHAAAAAADVARFELYQAAAGLRAAAQALDILESQLLPQADKSLQAARNAFAVGQGDVLGLLDAMRSFFEVRQEHIRASARFMSELAEVEFASGVPVFDLPTPPEAQP